MRILLLCPILSLLCQATICHHLISQAGSQSLVDGILCSRSRYSIIAIITYHVVSFHFIHYVAVSAALSVATAATCCIVRGGSVCGTAAASAVPGEGRGGVSRAVRTTVSAPTVYFSGTTSYHSCHSVPRSEFCHHGHTHTLRRVVAERNHDIHYLSMTVALTLLLGCSHGA